MICIAELPCASALGERRNDRAEHVAFFQGHDPWDLTESTVGGYEDSERNVSHWRASIKSISTFQCYFIHRLEQSFRRRGTVSCFCQLSMLVSDGERESVEWLRRA